MFLLRDSFLEHMQSQFTGVNDVLEAYKYSEALEINMLQLPCGRKHLPTKDDKVISNLAITNIYETKPLVVEYCIPYIMRTFPFYICCLR